MKKSNFALRLQPFLLEEARKVAEEEGVALNQFINIAVADKLAALRAAQYIAIHRARAQERPPDEGLRILARAGRNNPPDPGDEWDDDNFKAKPEKGALRIQRSGRRPDAAVAARRSQTAARKQRKVKR
jgi:hypothetical protein